MCGPVTAGLTGEREVEWDYLYWEQKVTAEWCTSIMSICSSLLRCWLAADTFSQYDCVVRVAENLDETAIDGLVLSGETIIDGLALC